MQNTQISPEILQLAMQIQNATNNEPVIEHSETTAKTSNLLSLSGLWKNKESGLSECFFGAGKLVLMKNENKKDDKDGDYHLNYVYNDGKKDHVSKISNLWVNRGKNEMYLSGGFGQLSLKIFANSDKKKDNQPNYLMYVSQKRYKPSVNPDDFELL